MCLIDDEVGDVEDKPIQLSGTKRRFYSCNVESDIANKYYDESDWDFFDEIEQWR